MKKIISFLISIIFIIGMVPTLTNAETNDNIVTGKCGKNAIWTLDETTKTVTISGTGKIDLMTDAYSSNYGWFPTKFNNLVIEDTITSIDDYAFEGQFRMTSVKIGSGVTEIGEGAFNGCDNLHKITVPPTVKKIGLYALGMSYYNGDMEGIYFQETAKKFTLCGAAGSAADKYASKYFIHFNDINGHSPHNYGKKTVVQKKVCGHRRGIKCRQCKDCVTRRYYYTNSDHTYGKIKTVKKGTYFKKGLKTQTCSYCHKVYKIRQYKKLACPTFKKATTTKTQFKYTYKKVKDATHYQVQITDYDEKYVRTKTTKNLSVTFKNLKKNTKYNCAVRAIIKKGNKKVYSDWNSRWRTTKK